MKKGLQLVADRHIRSYVCHLPLGWKIAYKSLDLMSKYRSIAFLPLLVLLVSAPAWAQGRGLAYLSSPAAGPDLLPAQKGAEIPLEAPRSLPWMAPELALQTFLARAQRQNDALASYTATSLIKADLVDTKQTGAYELKRQYIAPSTLKFTPVKFEGDGFVKNNVILRLLQSEADHVQKGDRTQTALTEANYKFNFKGAEYYDGKGLLVFQVKPRKKRPGLFKGRLYLEPTTGSLRRVEGTLVKSPSLFVKKIEFVQEYADVGEFTFPVHVHSVAKTRLVGRAVVDVVTREYEAASAAQVAKTATVAGSN